MALSPSEPASINAVEKTQPKPLTPCIPIIDQSELHHTISIRGILARASLLRDGIECIFALGTDMKPISGGQCIIFVVEYIDGVRYAFRLPYHSRN